MRLESLKLRGPTIWHFKVHNFIFSKSWFIYQNFGCWFCLSQCHFDLLYSTTNPQHIFFGHKKPASASTTEGRTNRQREKKKKQGLRSTKAQDNQGPEKHEQGQTQSPTSTSKQHTRRQEHEPEKRNTTATFAWKKKIAKQKCLQAWRLWF